ncbi:MAG: response regulator transcription factor [Alcanivorax sediminis]|uniref:response regulator transcription factor n=1 Tax=Alcanivorax sediminis TaxID=2663008 RepID=UPI003C506692
MDTTALNIVLVEDHDALREVTTDVLRQSGHHVTALECAEDLDQLASLGAVNLFILDLNLPGEDGISLARRLRQGHPSVGIIMTTARSLPQEQTEGYASGADIYLVKPLASDTLLAAVASMARRLQPAPAPNGLTLLESELCLRSNDVNVSLQAVEANLLVAMIRAPGQRLETWQIGEILGADEDGLSKSAIEVRMTRLRKKLRDCGAESPAIKSLRNVGYQLCVSVTIS